jgi:glycosyltransferase involved in cell wall biosynthesis
LFETLAVRKAKGFIAPTKYAGEVSAQLFGLYKEQIKTIHYGLDLTQFNNEHPERFEKGLILYIGTIIRKKGVFELPEIFNKVRNQFPEAKLVLIGGDSRDVATGNKSTWELVKQQFNEKDLGQVSYLGKIPYAEVQDYIKKANVCVFPTYAETLGMVTIESMAMQKAVVNSNIGWAQELMEDGKSGFLVHPAAHQEFADKIVQVLNDASFTAKMGVHARTYVETHFDITNKVEENIKYYQHLIK